MKNKVQLYRRKLAFILTLLITAVMITAILPGCNKHCVSKTQEAREIRVMTRINANCYYLDNGEPRGFEYDLAAEFAEFLGAELKIMTPRWEDLFKMLNDNQGDIAAANMTITPERFEKVDFSDSCMEITQKIVYHKDGQKVDSLEDLAGKVIDVRRGTSYQANLEKPEFKKMGVSLRLHDDTPTEELIRQVAEGEIELTVADSHIAMLNRSKYPQIVPGIDISQPQNLGWAVKKGNQKLLEEINRFLKQAKQDGTLQEISDRYFPEN